MTLLLRRRRPAHSLRHNRFRPRRVLLLGGLALLVVGSVVAAPAEATVGTTPAADTPYLTNADKVITALTFCGNRIYAAGAFGSITQGGRVYSRGNGFSFDVDTGQMYAFNPQTNGPIYSIAMSPDCKYAYIGGRFSDVKGTPERNLAKVGSVFGYADTTFNPNPDDQVNGLAVIDHGSQVIVGGRFTKIGRFGPAALASVRPTNGYVTPYLGLAVTGAIAHSGPVSRVNNLQVGLGGTRMLIEGNFTSVGGVAHRQIAELDLGADSATMDAWSNATINTTSCATDIPFYIRDAAFSPDGSTIYTAATGRDGSSPFCDAVSAFVNDAAATKLWVNKTGQDSLYSVAASDTDVYVGGHQRWMNNPHGHNNCGAGCVPRQGIASVDPSTGLVTTWNPGRTRGHGADAILPRPQGLFVASDDYLGSTRCAGVYHPGLCFFPGTP